MDRDCDGGFGVYLVVRTMQANADRVFSLVDSFPVPEGTGSLPGLAPSLAPGLALTVEGLRVTDLSPNFEWIQPEHTVYGIHGGNEGEQILEALAGLRDPFQGRIEHSGERIALISGESPLPPISPQDMLSAAYGSIMTPDAVEDILIRVGLRNLDPERPLPEGVDDDQRRRLALAQAIVKPPALVLADCSTLDGHPLREFFPASTLVTLWRPQDSEARTNVDHVVTPQPRGA